MAPPSAEAARTSTSNSPLPRDSSKRKASLDPTSLAALADIDPPPCSSDSTQPPELQLAEGMEAALELPAAASDGIFVLEETNGSGRARAGSKSQLRPASPFPTALQPSSPRHGGDSSEFRVGSAGGSGRHSLMRAALGLNSPRDRSSASDAPAPAPYGGSGGSLSIDPPAAPAPADTEMREAPPAEPRAEDGSAAAAEAPRPPEPTLLRVRCGVVVGPDAAKRMAAQRAPEFEFQGVPSDVPLDRMRESLLRRCGAPAALEPCVAIRYLDEDHDWVLLRRAEEWAICVQTAVSNAARRASASRAPLPPLVRLRVEIGLQRGAAPEAPAPP